MTNHEYLHESSNTYWAIEKELTDEELIIFQNSNKDNLESLGFTYSVVSTAEFILRLDNN